MGRPRTGSAWQHGDHYDIRITLADGSRGVPICLHDVKATSPDKSKCPGYAIALGRAKLHTERAAREGATRAKSKTGIISKTAPDWAEAWFADRERRGIVSVGDDRRRWRKWVAPVLQETLMPLVTRDDIEAIVERLDAAIEAEEIAWKTASNVWTLVTTAFGDATSSKNKALRVRSDNPTVDVRGPETGARRSKTYLYPSEFLKFAGCRKVPLRWRRLVALACYTGMRQAEIRGLRWQAVDFEAGTIEVHQTEDDSGEIATTKNEQTRKVPIEPALRPLLELLKRDATDERVITVPPEDELAVRVRAYLRRAGCERERLYTNDATRIHFRFHDCKGTAATWWVIAGVDHVKVMYRVAHGDFKTTKLYVSEAENSSFKSSDVFPTLPPEIFESSDESSGYGEAQCKSPKTQAKRRGDVRVMLPPKVGSRSTGFTCSLTSQCRSPESNREGAGSEPTASANSATSARPAS